MNIYKLTLCLLITFLIACKQDSSNISKERPVDAWIFRSVIDGNPRMITLALHDDLWVAYHTEQAALYKVWKGDVEMVGAVYDTQHGPQPLSAGKEYFTNYFKNPWISKGDTLSARYKGHKVEDDHPVLMYDLGIKTNPVSIEEHIDAIQNDNGQMVLKRDFKVKNLGDRSLSLDLNIAPIITEKSIITDGNLTITSVEDLQKGGKLYSSVRASLALKEGTNKLHVNLANIFEKIENTDANGEEIEDVDGAKLIAQNDCKTCHNKKRKTIGPSYVSIAERYKNTESNINYLSGKVKKGGSGVWGNQIMNAHPAVPQADIEAMVSYIMELDAEEDKGQGEDTADIGELVSPSDTTITSDELIPGAIVRVYNVSPTTVKIPLQPTKKPRAGGILPNFDNLTGGAWKDLEENFSLYAEGYIYIEKAGSHTFRIWSDDGSIVYLNEEKILDNDGPHGTQYREVSMNLAQGYHPFKLDFYQGAGGKFLSWNWKRPNVSAFEVIPPNNIYHKITDGTKVEGLSLAMANSSALPGDANPLLDVHPSFDLSQARPDDFLPKVGGISFISNERMIISTWDATGSVYAIDNYQSGDPSAMTVTRLASGLAEPLGLTVVDGDIYVLQKQELTRLVDTDGDAIIDEYQTVCNSWLVSNNFHEFAFGLVHDGKYFYATLATGIQPGGAGAEYQPADRGSCVRIDPTTGEYKIMANGFRTPNGIGMGYGDEIFVADNQGDWLPASKIAHVTEGDWFGNRAVDFEGTAETEEKPPVVWLPQDEIGNSPSTPLGIEIGPYKGQLIHGEVTHGGVKRVYVEEVNGQLQGCVFRFIQGLEAGVNRIAWGPDGALYAGGIGNPGNWGQSGKLWYGLQRLAYNEKSTFEMLKVEAMTNGLTIEFTEPLSKDTGWDPSSYEIQQWYYTPDANYGGPKRGLSNIPVKSATVSEDRKKVFLEIPGIKKGHVVYVHLKDRFLSENLNSLWTTEAWYTMNNMPQEKIGQVKPIPYKVVDNQLSPSEKAEGWQLLFDGKSIDHFRTFKKDKITPGWVINQEAIHLTAKKEEGNWQTIGGGDIISINEYENFDFKVDWKISNCGNSGIMFNVIEAEKYDYVWLTGPEIQVLDNVCHPDTRFVTHRAGDLYDMIETKYITVKPAGEWNSVRIISKEGKVRVFQNGVEVVNFEMHNQAWLDMIANSKFKDMPDFGLAKKGHISLQDHGDKVWYKNIKIRKL